MIWGTGPFGTDSWGGGATASAEPPVIAAVGSWGIGPWGTGTWGGVGEVTEGPRIDVIGPVVADVLGGTVIAIFGTGFVDPAIIELFSGALKVGEGKYFEARLDMLFTKMLVGLPPLPVGSYGLKVTTPYGASAILEDAIQYKVFAEETKVHRVRRRWAEAWQLGERLLR
jgi:hypothetical protein